MNNEEWLKTLSDKQLDDEIKYGAVLAESGSHKESAKRELAQALLEKQIRNTQ